MLCRNGAAGGWSPWYPRIAPGRLGAGRTARGPPCRPGCRWAWKPAQGLATLADWAHRARRGRWMMSRSWRGATALTLVVALAGCVGEVPPGSHTQLAPVQAPTPPAGPPHVALLLPLTGPRGDLGAAMLKAAQMALSVPGGPMADIRDTAGDPAK